MANAWDERKKGLEEEYFHRKEQEALERTRQRRASEAMEHEHEGALIRCPKCVGTLEETTFEGIQVDRCTGCQGVWLDPGELERLTAQDNQGWLARFWHTRTERKKEREGIFQ